MGRTCGESDEIELTAIGVELNGSQVHPRGPRRSTEARVRHRGKRAVMFFGRVGISLGFVRLPTRAEAHVEV